MSRTRTKKSNHVDDPELLIDTQFPGRDACSTAIILKFDPKRPRATQTPHDSASADARQLAEDLLSIQHEWPEAFFNMRRYIDTVMDRTREDAR